MSPRAAMIGVHVFTALVAASIGIALAGLTWRLVGDPGTRFGSTPVAARPARPVDLGPLIAATPFGDAAPIAAQTSNQPLTLRGILLAVPREASTALIQIGDAPPSAFGIGQAVGGGTIDAITLDHILLRVGGGQQILAFPTPAGSTPSPGIAAAGAPAPTSAPPPPAPPGGNFFGALGGQQSADGYQVGAQPGPAAQLAGLQPGDVIAHVDGVAVADLMRDPAAMARAAADGSAQLDVVRGGRRLTLVVPLR